MKPVSSITCNSYDLEEVYQAVSAALGKISFIIPDNKTVLIKPNIIAQNSPDDHSVTHYSIIDALCRILKEHDCRILIGDSIAFYQKGLTRKAFETTKLKMVAEKYGAHLVAFDEEPLTAIRSGLTKLDVLYIPKVLLDADMVINACKLKTHGSLRMSGAIKNMFGCLPGGYKQKLHQWMDSKLELSDIFLDVHNIVRPSLSVMDAVISLDGGPSAIGKPVRTARILASENAAALDLAACRILGYDPGEIYALIRARDRHFIDSYDDVRIIGTVEPGVFKKLIKGPIETHYNKNGFFIKYTWLNLKINNSKCTRCGRCQKACPTKSIRSAGRTLSIDTGTCISCYYCLSVCPTKAVRINPTLINRFILAARKIAGV